MIRSLAARTVLVGALLTGSVAAGPALAAGQAGAALTPAAAAPFVGDWTLNLEGPNGPGTFELSVKVENEKVTAQISGGTGTNQPIPDISKSGESLVLSYSFNYEGNAVDATVRLTPAPEAKTNAEISFAGGAYVMNGTATKKEKGK